MNILTAFYKNTEETKKRYLYSADKFAHRKITIINIHLSSYHHWF